MSRPAEDDANAWERTLGEAEDGRVGLVYVPPDSVGEELPALVERDEFDRYETFRRQVGSDLFLLTKVTTHDADAAVLLVGAVDLSTAQPLIDVARERSELHSHVRLLDETHLATFHHEDPDHFPG